MSFPETELLTAFVARIFRIEDVTSADPTKGFFLRYRGQLLGDSAEAYDTLADALRSYAITPLFRVEEGRQVIYLAPARVEKNDDKISTNIILFVLTVFSVMLAGAQPEGPVPQDTLGQMLMLARSIFTGWPFALSFLGILVAHEFGHYFMSRYHKTPATLPYFIPLPFVGLLGTMGAAIIMRGIPKNKRVLFDIGVAGPIAGLVVAIPVLFLGLSLSTLGTIEPVAGGYIEGNSLLYMFAKYVVFGQFLPTPLEPQGIVYWLRYFFTGGPIPFGGTDVFIHPVAFAGWGGLLVTALNLIPAGTLDGGHVVYSLFGDKVKKFTPYIIGLLVMLGFFWSGWWLWAFLLFWLGRVYAEPLDQITELTPGRRAIGYLMILVFLLVFMPVPMMWLTQ